ncbi:MAG: glycoside hydrolase family 16 protein [Bacteroidota bacterium]
MKGPFKLLATLFVLHLCILTACTKENNAPATYIFRDEFNSFDTSLWNKPNHATPGSPSNGWFFPGNVSVGNGALGMRIPANTKDGAELSSLIPYDLKNGSFSARIKCPSLPGTLTTLFSYQGVDYGDEIDIEIWNDGSRRVDFTLWKYEISQINHDPVYTIHFFLTFDPSSSYHEYRVDFDQNKISCVVDGLVKDTMTSQSVFPTHPMYLMANTWWPSWMNGKVDSADKYACYDWIQH